MIKNCLTAAGALALLAQGGPALALDHTAKLVRELHADADRPCVMFRLEGVSQADPAVSSAEWFTLPKSHPSYNEQLAFLLTATATKMPLNIRTSGGTACGFASVNILGFS